MALAARRGRLCCRAGPHIGYVIAPHAPIPAARSYAFTCLLVKHAIVLISRLGHDRSAHRDSQSESFIRREYLFFGRRHCPDEAIRSTPSSHTAREARRPLYLKYT